MKRGIDFVQSDVGSICLPFQAESRERPCEKCDVLYGSCACLMASCASDERRDGMDVIWKMLINGKMADLILSAEVK